MNSLLKKKFSLQQKFLLTIFFIIVPVLGLVFSWVEAGAVRRAKEQALDKARIVTRQVIVVRQWITDCDGGVWVPQKSQGARNTSCFFDKKIKTRDGIFQCFTPSMVTKKLSQYAARENFYSFRLSSLNPMNSENIPDDFERTALSGFITSASLELYRFSENKLDYAVPLFMEKGCLKCHHRKDSPHNNIMGALSVTIPLDNVYSSLKKNGILLAAAGLTITLLTVFSLFFLLRKMVIMPLRELEEKTKQIGLGNLETRVLISTGDELEKLGNHFNVMAQKILQGRDSLEKKVDRATRDLACANENLRQLDKLKSDFLANMSHELRSPITVIRGGIDYLSRTLEKKDNKTYVDIMGKNISRLHYLVSDLFNFTRLEAGKVEWDFGKENLGLLVKEVIEIMSPIAKEKNLNIVYENTIDIFADMDFERVEQVIVNIMDNAIKYSDPDEDIIVAVQSHGSDVIVSVENKGRMIPEEHLESIFDKFSTVPSGRNTKTEGTGLGLAISKAIIEAHNGRIWAKSHDGRSTFFFTLSISKK